MKEIVLPLIPFTIYVLIIISILTICFVVAGVGGSLLFYIIIFFYVRALFAYNPVLEARQQAEEAAMMNQQQ